MTALEWVGVGIAAWVMVLATGLIVYGMLVTRAARREITNTSREIEKRLDPIPRRRPQF